MEKKGIYIGTHISKCAGVCDRAMQDLPSDIATLNDKTFAVLDECAEKDMKNAIKTAKENGDSVGGVLETAVIGMSVGVGEPWFDSVESALSHMLFSIPAVKGVEFGSGFGIADMLGSNANDAMEIKDGKVVTTTNNSGGINGGITNGMPIIFRTAIKPTPTIYKEQNTVDYTTMKNATLTANGRHDPAIVQRARIVQDTATAIVLCDMLAQRFGTDYLK